MWRPSALEGFDVGFLVFEAALEQDLEERIVPFRTLALALRLGHLERGAMAAAQEVREVGGGQD